MGLLVLHSWDHQILQRQSVGSPILLLSTDYSGFTNHIRFPKISLRKIFSLEKLIRSQPNMSTSDWLPMVGYYNMHLCLGFQLWSSTCTELDLQHWRITSSRRYAWSHMKMIREVNFEGCLLWICKENSTRQLNNKWQNHQIYSFVFQLLHWPKYWECIKAWVLTGCRRFAWIEIIQTWIKVIQAWVKVIKIILPGLWLDIVAWWTASWLIQYPGGFRCYRILIPIDKSKTSIRERTSKSSNEPFGLHFFFDELMTILYMLVLL